MSNPIDQYLNYSGSYFTSNSTFVFLNGNHTVQKSFRLRNISNLTLRGTGSDAKAMITFASRYSIIRYHYMSNLRIEWLTLNFSNHEGKVLTVMEIIKSKGVKELPFQGPHSVETLALELTITLSLLCTSQRQPSPYIVVCCSEMQVELCTPLRNHT